MISNIKNDFNRNLAFAGILTSIVISVLMQTFITTAMPIIAQEFKTIKLYHWVFSSYLLISTITIPTFSKLAEIEGRKKIYFTGLIFLLIGALLSGFSRSMFQLVLFRAIMGVGSGAVVPTALASIGDIFTEKDRGKVFGVIGVLQVIATAIGPLLGGWITDSFSWRWCFFIIVFLCLLCGLFVIIGLPTRHNDSDTKVKKKGLWKTLDWKGSVLITLFLLSFLLGMQFIKDNSYFLGSILLVLSIPVGIIMVFTERKKVDPVLPIFLMEKERLLYIILGAFIMGAFFNTAVAFIPLFFQNSEQLNAIGIGIRMVPLMIGAALGSFVSGGLKAKWYTLAFAHAWILPAISFGLLASLFHGMQNIILIFVLAAIGYGSGILLPLFFTIGQDRAGDNHRAVATRFIQLSRNLGGSIAVTSFGLLIGDSFDLSIKSIFICISVVTFLGLFTILLKPSEIKA